MQILHALVCFYIIFVFDVGIRGEKPVLKDHNDDTGGVQKRKKEVEDQGPFG